MKTIVVYHSHSGKTKFVAEKIKSNLSADCIEVQPKHAYSSVMVYPKGIYRARKGEKDPVNPDTIDISGYDQIVIASPVWAGKPTPVINGAIEVLTGCAGKKAFLLLTCGVEKSGNEAVTFFKESLKQRGMVVSGEAVLDRNHVHDPATIAVLVKDIRAAGEEI